MMWWESVLIGLAVVGAVGAVAGAISWWRSGLTRNESADHFRSLGVDLARLPGRLRRVAADPRTPRSARWWLTGLAIYIAFPLDPLPDFIPLIGQLDELVIAPLVLWHVRRMIPEDVWFEYFPPKSDRIGRTARR